MTVFSLYGDYSNSPFGIHLGFNGEKTIRRRDTGYVIRSFTGNQTFYIQGSQYNDVLDASVGGGGNDNLYGNGGNDLLIGGGGIYDYLDGGFGQDTLVATEGSIVGGTDVDTLIADYSHSPYNAGVHLGFNGEKTIRRRDNGAVVLSYDGIEALKVTGTRYADYLVGGTNNDSLFGGSGNDTFVATNGLIDGGAGQDKLIADYSQANYNGSGIHFGYVETGVGTFSTVYGNPAAKLLNYTDIDQFQVTGTRYNDYIYVYNNGSTAVGGEGNDTLYGYQSTNESLFGGAGDDILNGDSNLQGNDFDRDYLEGGDGNDQMYALNGSDTLKGGTGDDVIYAVSGIQGATKELWGNEGADRFILDVKGEVGLGFNFNTQLLSNFVRDVTIPQNNGPNWERMGIDLGFGLASTAVSVVPGVGGAAGFLIAATQMGVNAYLNEEKAAEAVRDQINTINNATNTYRNGNWGNVFLTGTRDTLVIKDFKVGIDTIVLPKLKEGDVYQIDQILNGDQNFVQLSIRTKPSGSNVEQLVDVVRIENNYQNVLTVYEFGELISNLIDGASIGTFSKTIKTGENQDPGDGERDLTGIGKFARDIIDAQGGDDIAFGYYSDDIIFGGEGNDILYGGHNNNSRYTQFESVYGHDGNDSLDGGNGNDKLYGETGDDYLLGGVGNDYLDGGRGNDTLYGETGRDTLYGGIGDDILDGGDGNDYLDGGVGNNTLKGGAGNDTLVAGIGRNTVNGGSGSDTLVADYSQSSYLGVHLGWLGQNAIFGRNNEGVVLFHQDIESFQITGTRYADAFEGRSYNDTFTGGEGNDYLSGAGGNDILVGGAGNDILVGGAGNDTLTGGGGADKFVFNSLSEGIDRITDFNRAQGDKIEVSSTFGATSINQFSFNTNTGALLFDNQQFATLQNASGFNVTTDIVLL